MLKELTISTFYLFSPFFLPLTDFSYKTQPFFVLKHQVIFIDVFLLFSSLIKLYFPLTTIRAVLILCISPLFFYLFMMEHIRLDPELISLPSTTGSKKSNDSYGFS